MKCDHHSCHREADHHASRVLDGEYCARHAVSLVRSLNLIAEAAQEELDDFVSFAYEPARSLRFEVLA